MDFHFDGGEDYYKSHDRECLIAFLITQADAESQNSSSKSELADEVLVENGSQFEQSAKSDKEATDIKFKGNRKQFEVYLRLDNILTQIQESASSPSDSHKLLAETDHQKASEVD